MKLFTCYCGWQFVVTKKHIYGPIWPDDLFDKLAAARIQSRSDFKNGYADCHADYKRKKAKS